MSLTKKKMTAGLIGFSLMALPAMAWAAGKAGAFTCCPFCF